MTEKSLVCLSITKEIQYTDSNMNVNYKHNNIAFNNIFIHNRLISTILIYDINDPAMIPNISIKVIKIYADNTI